MMKSFNPCLFNTVSTEVSVMPREQRWMNISKDPWARESVEVGNIGIKVGLLAEAPEEMLSTKIHGMFEDRVELIFE